MLGTFCESGAESPRTRPMSSFPALEFSPVETTTCFRCGRPACPECLRDAPVGSHCFECVRAAEPPAAQRVRQRAALGGPVVTKAIVWLNVGVFLLTATSAGGSIMGEGVSQLHLK